MIEFKKDIQGQLQFGYDQVIKEALFYKIREAEDVLCLAVEKGGLQLPTPRSVVAHHPFAHLLVAYSKGLCSSQELGDSPLALSQLSATALNALSQDRVFVAQDRRLLPSQDTRQESFALVSVDPLSEARFQANLTQLLTTLGSPWRAFIGILRTITFVEVASLPGLPYFSGSWNLTFGAMHMIYSDSLPILAECITHEAAHTWLSLVDDNDRFARDMWNESSQWISPWREDPRPIGGVVHGVFVFSCVLVVLEVLVKRMSDQIDAAKTRKRIARIASGVIDGLEVLHSSGLLTEEGEQLCRESEARLNFSLPAAGNEWSEIRATSRAIHLQKIASLYSTMEKSNGPL